MSSNHKLYRWESGVLAAVMLAAAAAAWVMTPTATPVTRPTLAQLVPAHFGEWKAVGSSGLKVVDPSIGPAGGRATDTPYSDVLMRAYADGRGNVVLLALAYGAQQHQEVKIHRPEVCYVAQGFEVVSHSAATFPLAQGAHARGSRLLVRTPDRIEAVSYWIRIGGTYSNSAWATRYYLFKEGLKGRVVDGILVRASQIVDSTEAASPNRFAVQERFLAELVQSLPPQWRTVLAES
jgi:EpsI family protein